MRIVPVDDVRRTLGGPVPPLRTEPADLALLVYTLWEMESPDADRYFGEVLRAAAKGTRLSRAQALKTHFLSWSCGTRSRSTR